MSRSQIRRLSIAALAAVALLGIIHLAFPFGGDQALFTLGGIQMHAGAALYRGFWDIKQPGIYMFYLAAGSLFGFSEIGVHAFELLYLLVFAVILQRTVTRVTRMPIAGAASPFLAVGLYYANATWFSLTQVEALAGFPLYLSLYFALVAVRENRWFGYAFAAGACGAIALYFKLLFLPLLLLMWAAVLFTAARTRPRVERRLFIGQGIALIGALIAVTVLWLLVTMLTSGVHEVIATFFTLPLQIRSMIPAAPVSRLAASASGYAVHALVLLALAVVALSRRGLWRDPFWNACCAWIAGAVIVILLQRQSWWPYQFQLLDVPLAILAAYGAQELWEREQTRASDTRGIRLAATAAPLILLLLLAAPAKQTGTAMSALARSGLAITPAGRERFHELIDPSDTSAAQTRFLREPSALQGPIYVCGDPRYYLAAGRTQALSITGWALEVLGPAQWIELRDELVTRHPVYVFVAATYRDLIDERAPAFALAIRKGYRLVHHDGTGDWYEADARP